MGHSDGCQKSEDLRIRRVKYKKKARKKSLLFVGISDFCKASTDYYYVDKTMPIKGFLDEHPMVSLFTYPRRFGKTLNTDMLRTFFEISENDTSLYFQDKKIGACGKKHWKVFSCFLNF